MTKFSYYQNLADAFKKQFADVHDGLLMGFASLQVIQLDAVETDYSHILNRFRYESVVPIISQKIVPNQTDTLESHDDALGPFKRRTHYYQISGLLVVRTEIVLNRNIVAPIRLVCSNPLLQLKEEN